LAYLQTIPRHEYTHASLNSLAMRNAYVLATIGGLLSSSCCLIQLLLNSFSVGCAGFAILTPYRPIFLAATTILLGYNVQNYGLTKATISSILLASSLSVSSEVLSLLNQGKFLNKRRKQKKLEDPQKVTLTIDGLGCEACATRVKNALNSLEGVASCQVYFENKTAIVQMSQANAISHEKLVDAIEAIDEDYKAQVLPQLDAKEVLMEEID